MKPNLPLQACMLRLYQRYKQSQKTRAAFCREEGITAAQFTYWCRRFDQESNSAVAIPAPIIHSQVSTPIQAVKESVER
jgi:transposase-like protein